MTKMGPVVEDHACSVFQKKDGWWQIECPTCGPFDMVQSLENDARNIAARHEEVGGFERRS